MAASVSDSLKPPTLRYRFKTSAKRSREPLSPRNWRDSAGAPERGYVSVSDKEDLLREIARQARGAIEARGCIDDDEVEHAGDHLEEAGVVGGGRFGDDGTWADRRARGGRDRGGP